MQELACKLKWTFISHFLVFLYEKLYINFFKAYNFDNFAGEIQYIQLLRILTGKKHPQIKLQHFRKVWIWTFGWLVHQINPLYEILELKQNFWKNKVIFGKTPLFLVDPFCTSHSICLHWLLTEQFCIETLRFQP